MHHPIDTRDELLEAYMVGQRLVKFLSIILPTHVEYSNQIDVRARAARERSLEQLAVVTKYIDQIALLIDKQEHEDYISLVINQHQDEKSTKSHSAEQHQREDVYYVDDADDDGERNCTYLATSNTRGSDSTERLNNVSSGNSEASSYQERSNVPTSSRLSTLGKQVYQPNAHDSSVVSDSVDVLYDNSNSNSRDNFVRKDPISTASHTILRVVSPYQDVQTPPKYTNEQNEIKMLHGNDVSDQNILGKKEESFSSKAGSCRGMNSRTEMPIIRSHWVANNRSNNCSGVPNSAETSFSSADRSFSSANRIVSKQNTNFVSTASIHQSPGGSVRSIIRSWPPKQDPPGDPPGVNSTALNTDVVGKRVITPVAKQASNTDSSFSSSKAACATSPPETDIVTLQYKPMTELQSLAAELDKASPSRTHQKDLKTTNATFLTRRDPSIGSQFARFSSTSYSTSSCDRSAADESDCIPAASRIKKSCVVSPDLSEKKSNGSQVVTSSDSTCILRHDDSAEERFVKEHNVSLDSIGFPKVKEPVTPQVTESDISLEARIMSIASNAAISHSPNENERDVSSERHYHSHFLKDEGSQNSSIPENFAFPVHFESQVTPELAINDHHDINHAQEVTENSRKEKAAQNTSLSKVAMSVIPGSRQSGPVDLDDSASTYGTIAPDDEADAMTATSRAFASDGLDYVLPLPKNISRGRNANPMLGSYAPSAADWSMDEEIETSNRRFARENSTISIDSTEFSGNPHTRKDTGNIHRNGAEFEEPLDNVFGSSTDWTPVWSPQDFDSFSSSNIYKEKITDQSNTSNLSPGRPDLSYEAWDQVWNSASKKINKSRALDSRKEIIANGNSVQKGEYYPDRTSSTGSSSSTSRSRDHPQDIASSEKTLSLLDPYSSRTPIEAPFLRDDKESPLMIDSVTEQRLRLPMNMNGNVKKTPSNRLNLPPHNVGLYGSLKGFQSLDCILPFDHDDTNQNVDNSRGNILFCRSRAITATHHRSPNEDD